MPSSGVQTCALDRKSTRLNSSHGSISYAVFCLKKQEKSDTIATPEPEPIDSRPSTRKPSRDGPLCLATPLSNGAGHSPASPRAFFFFFNDPATTEISPLPLPAAFPT